MPVLVRYCIMAIWSPFFLSTGATTFILNLLFFLNEFLEYVFRYKAGFVNSFLLLLYIQPGFLILAVPIGFLTAIMVVYGRMSADREVVAVESCGFSIWVLVWPMICVSVLMSLFLVLFWDVSLPWGNTSFLKLQYKIISERSTVVIRERTFIKDFDGYVLYVREKDEKNDLMKNIMVQQLDEKGYPYRLILAKEGTMRQDPDNFHVLLDLNSGVMQQIGTKKSQKTNEFFQMQFKTCQLDLSANRLKSGPIDLRSPRNISIKELAIQIAEEKRQNRDTRYYEVEFYKKFSMPFSALAFAFIGIPLSLMGRTGSFTGPFFAVVLVFIYWLFDVFGENSSPMGGISPFWAMWLPNIVLTFTGFVLVYWLNHKHDFWKNLLQKIGIATESRTISNSFSATD